jgi:hypothetical protein
MGYEGGFGSASHMGAIGTGISGAANAQAQNNVVNAQAHAQAYNNLIGQSVIHKNYWEEMEEHFQRRVLKARFDNGEMTELEKIVYGFKK